MGAMGREGKKQHSRSQWWWRCFAASEIVAELNGV